MAASEEQYPSRWEMVDGEMVEIHHPATFTRWTSVPTSREGQLSGEQFGDDEGKHYKVKREPHTAPMLPELTPQEVLDAKIDSAGKMLLRRDELARRMASAGHFDLAGKVTENTYGRMTAAQNHINELQDAVEGLR